MNKRLRKFIWKLTPFKRKLLMHVNYNSGIQEEFWVYYVYKHSNPDKALTSLRWILAKSERMANPLMLNVDAIESVWVADYSGIFILPKSFETK